jgi:hypothetical protein
MFVNVVYEVCHGGLGLRKWTVGVTSFVQLITFLFILLLNAGGEIMVGELDHIWKQRDFIFFQFVTVLALAEFEMSL